MTRLMTVIGLIVLATAVPVLAQQPTAAGSSAQTPTPPATHTGSMMPMHMCREMMMSGQSTMGPGMMGGNSMMGAGMMGPGMMGPGMMGPGMMGPGMMGPGMMGPGMMGPGMMAGQSTDPKTMAEMMEMRGEMMKAMGDIMLKHVKRMQETPPPAK
jgi:hypothetical protein